MKKTAYVFRQKDSTDEVHIFKGTFNDDEENRCTVGTSSICKKAQYNSSNKHRSQCLTESEARHKAAKIGRTVCGTCVSHLYESY